MAVHAKHRDEHSNQAHKKSQHGERAHASDAANEEGLKDPVCGMTVTEQSPHRFEHQRSHPLLLQRGLQREIRGRTDKVSRTETCRSCTGICPGLPARSTPVRCTRRSDAIVRAIARSAAWRSGPSMPSLDEEESPELVDFSRRFWWTLPLTIAVTGACDVRASLALV